MKTCLSGRERQTEKIRKYNNQVARSLHLDEILAETVDIIHDTVESSNIYISYSGTWQR